MIPKTLVLMGLVALVWPGLPPQAQDLRRHHEQIRRLRKEIRDFEQKIAESQRQEQSILGYLANLDLEIDLIHSLLQKLRAEEAQKKRQVAELEQSLKRTEEELARLKEAFARRLVYFYKYGRIKDLELLLSARSINQGLLWIEYQKRLSEHDRRNYLKIREKQEQLRQDRARLAREIEHLQSVIAEQRAEEKRLKEKKKKRQEVLAEVRQDTELLRQQMAEKERAVEEIRNIIADLERQARRPESELIKPNVPFAQLKGRLRWPTQGQIVTHFGRYVHPELKTVTENIGIDIQAPAGAPVYAVASGRVTAIRWQRGRGNIIIVSHYGGYYTVYTHLQEIWVGLQEEVTMGQVIGTVGESGSLSGPMLHFEIWHGTSKLNPEMWLQTS